MEIDLLKSLAVSWPLLSTILTVLGGISVVGKLVIVMTPTKADDEAWSKLESLPIVGGFFKALAYFAPKY